jgi:exosortase K
VKRWQLVAAAAIATTLLAAKSYYSGASTADLAWLLAPTAKLVGLVTGHTFAYEAGSGWVSHEARFVIAPACAGLNFAMAAFLALSIGWWRELVTARAVATRLPIAAVIACAATLVINTIRISIAVAMRSGAELHRIEGTIVYVVGLCALYAAAQVIGRNRHALGRS